MRDRWGLCLLATNIRGFTFLLLHALNLHCIIDIPTFSPNPLASSPALEKHIAIAHDHLQKVDQCDADMPILTEDTLEVACVAGAGVGARCGWRTARMYSSG